MRRFRYECLVRGCLFTVWGRTWPEVMVIRALHRARHRIAFRWVMRKSWPRPVKAEGA